MTSKKSKEQYILEASKLHNNKYDYSEILELPKRDTRVDIICPTHGIFNQSFHKHLQGDGCKKCGIEKTARERIEKAKNKFINEANIKHDNKYDYSKSLYTSATDNIIICCLSHGDFEQTPNRHLGGAGCRKCGIDKTKEKLIIPWNEYRDNLNIIHDNKYNYSKVIWKGVDINIIVICPKHGDFEIRPASHKRGKGCQKCSTENKIQYNKLNNEIFINKSNDIWNNLYDYSKINYIDSLNKVIIICKKHGEFEQLPQNHFKYGCGKCGNELNYRNIELNIKSKTEFISKANIIHENYYDYSKTDYKNARDHIIVICKLHGEFEVSPNNHLRGKGCRECGIESARLSKVKSFDDYHKEFVKLYKDKYDYSNVIWESASTPIEVICKKHNKFYVLPCLHKNGKECPKCSNQHSSISIEWLSYMEIKYNIEIEHAKNIGEFNIPNTRYKADGYNKSINTIFEFHGDFWHGNPEIYDKIEINPRVGISYGELYEKTLEKAKLIKQKGFKLIEIWENDWKNFIKFIKIIQNKFRCKRKIR
jgi:hypothetical protein